MSKEGSGVTGGILALFVVGAMAVYPFVAQMSEPPLEPTRTLIDLQAQWNDGMYGVKTTFLTTFVLVVLAILAPFFLFMGLHKAVFGRSQDQGTPLTLPTGSSLTWLRGSDFALGATGLALILASGGFSYVALTTPNKLSFVGSFGGFALFFAAFAPLPGLLMFLDTTLPKNWKQGRIESLTPGESTGGSPPSSFELVLEKKKFTIRADLASKLKVEEKIAVRTSTLFDRVMEIRR